MGDYWINVLASAGRIGAPVWQLLQPAWSLPVLSLFHDLEVDDRKIGIVLLLKSDEWFQIVSAILP